MAKRVVLLLLTVTVGACALLVIWQPSALKTRVLNTVARDLSKSIPYDIRIGQVNGNFWTGISLEDVHLLQKETSQELLTIQAVLIKISWGALLLHRTVQLDRLDVHLGDGVAVLKNAFVLKPGMTGPLTIEDRHFPLHRFLSLTGSTLPAIPLTHTGEWTIVKDTRTVDVTLSGDVDDAPMTLVASWHTSGFYRARLKWTDVPLATFLPAKKQSHEKASATLDVKGTGLMISGTGQLLWPGVAMNLQFLNGQGRFQAVVTEGGITSKLHGTLDLARKAVNGEGSIHQVRWQDASLENADFEFSANPQKQDLDIRLANLRAHHQKKDPLDIQAAHITLSGLRPHWKTSASLTCQNGAALTLEGRLHQDPHAWRLDWQHLQVSIPNSGVWQASTPGTATLLASHAVAIKEVNLKNGAQSLQMSQATFDKTAWEIHGHAEQFNPEPWMPLLYPEATLSGTMNATFDVQRTNTLFDVNGFINGHFPTLTVKSAGLDIHNVDLDAKSTHGNFEIKRFTGQTKKGDVRITGASQLPALNYELSVRQLVIQPVPEAKIAADANIHLGGTVDSARVTGQITVSEATYTVPKKEKHPKETASVQVSTATQATAPARQSLGTVDVTLQWPRNVWYRDGTSNIETRGDLRIQKSEDSPNLVLTGVITSLRGAYTYFGRSFVINTGQLQFAGTQEINPLMNIEAQYSNGPTTVYLDITGDVKHPVLKMRSNPPLPDQDIVSVIVFGQPLSELRTRSGGTSTNQEMMQAVGGVLGSYVSKGLNETGIPLLNVDILNIQPDSQGGSQLTVGRYLTRKLFISYGQTVQGSAEKSITADYFLTDKWTWQGASDSVEGNYMDLLFRYPLNKRGAPGNNSPIPNSPFRNSLDQPVIQHEFRTPMQ